MNSKKRGIDGLVRTIRGDGRFVGVDVGARGHLPADWSPLAGNAEFVCFDADPDACNELRETYRREGLEDSIRVVNAALAGSNGTRTLYLTHHRGGSGLFDPDTPLIRDYVDANYIFPVEKVEIETRNAREVMGEIGASDIDLLKLDIQGAELEVLRCLGPEFLDPVVCIQTEVAMHDRGNGTPVFRDVDAYLSSVGFGLYDVRLTRIHRTLDGARSNLLAGELGVNAKPISVNARVWEMDLLLFRPPEKTVELGEAKARNLAVAFCLYGFFSEALHTVKLMRERLDVASAEADRMGAAVTAWHRSTRYGILSGRGRLSRALRKVLQFLDLRPWPPWWPYR